MWVGVGSLCAFLGDFIMKFTKGTIAATFTGLLIGGLCISFPSAAVEQNGRVYTGTQAGFELKGESSYNDGRDVPKGTQPGLKSNAQGKTNGRQG
jgi:hypothetical protein